MARSMVSVRDVHQFRNSLNNLSHNATYVMLKHLPFPAPSLIDGGVFAGVKEAVNGVLGRRQTTIENAIEFAREAADQWLEPIPQTFPLPSPKVAPFNFDIVDKRLVVVSQPASASDTGATASARTALLEQGQRLLEALTASNSNPLLRDALQILQIKLSSGHDIVQLGLLNLTWEGAVHGAEDEVSAVMARSLQAHALGVRHYLAQYPEWVAFSDNAAELELSREELEALARETEQLADKLESEITVDEEVPRSLRFVANVRKQPAKELKRAGLALIRTIENLAISVFRQLSDFASTIFKQSLSAARVPVAGALGLAIAAIILHQAEIWATVSGAAWLKPAAEIIQRSEGALIGKVK
jgi:hypothetical protein